MYLEKEEVVAQCQKTQSQNQQNLSVKNPKHQVGIEAALSHAQKGARLESNTPMKTKSTKDGHNRLKKPQETISSGEPT